MNEVQEGIPTLESVVAAQIMAEADRVKKEKPTAGENPEAPEGLEVFVQTDEIVN